MPKLIFNVPPTMADRLNEVGVELTAAAGKPLDIADLHRALLARGLSTVDSLPKGSAPRREAARLVLVGVGLAAPGDAPASSAPPRPSRNIDPTKIPGTRKAARR